MAINLRWLNKKSVKGAIGELLVAAEYMKKGYYVARSTDPHCPFDLVITDDKGISTLIDVKCKSIRLSGRGKGQQIKRTTNAKQKEMGVVIVYVDCNTE